MKQRNILLTAFILALLMSCGEEEQPAPIQSQQNVPIQFLFGLSGQPQNENQFVAVTSNPDVIQKARGELALPEAERYLHIDGIIARGNGGYNLNWSWQFVSNEWDLVRMSIELCDGTPQDVEKNLDEWVDREFCPWASYVVEEIPGPEA